MTEVRITAIRDNSFNTDGEAFDPALVEKGIISMDDATGMKVVTTKDDDTDVEYYYVGEEVDYEAFRKINEGKESTTDQINKERYAKTFNISRFGILRDGPTIRDSKPLSPDEHMVESQELLFTQFNKALELQEQKRLTLFKKKDNKNSVPA